MKNLKKFNDSNGMVDHALKLKSQIKYVIKNSPFYKKKFAKHNDVLDANFDFAKLPHNINTTFSVLSDIFFIILDPMLATGNSSIEAINLVKKSGVSINNTIAKTHNMV